jgi:hypothetical protein
MPKMKADVFGRPRPVSGVSIFVVVALVAATIIYIIVRDYSYRDYCPYLYKFVRDYSDRDYNFVANLYHCPGLSI